jgi:hypothetical protein
MTNTANEKKWRRTWPTRRSDVYELFMYNAIEYNGSQRSRKQRRVGAKPITAEYLMSTFPLPLTAGPEYRAAVRSVAFEVANKFKNR